MKRNPSEPVLQAVCANRYAQDARRYQGPEQAEGLLRVLLTGGGRQGNLDCVARPRRVVDHCVCADATDALILDTAEDYLIKLLEHVSRMCGGDDADDLKIAEIWPLVAQREKRRKN